MEKLEPTGLSKHAQYGLLNKMYATEKEQHWETETALQNPKKQIGILPVLGVYEKSNAMAVLFSV